MLNQIINEFDLMYSLRNVGRGLIVFFAICVIIMLISILVASRYPDEVEDPQELMFQINAEIRRNSLNKKN